MAVTNPYPRDTAEWYRVEAMATLHQAARDEQPERALQAAQVYATLALSAKPAPRTESAWYGQMDVRG